MLFPEVWTTGWDNDTNTAYAIKQDHVVVYDNIKSIEAKVFLFVKLKIDSEIENETFKLQI